MCLPDQSRTRSPDLCPSWRFSSKPLSVQREIFPQNACFFGNKPQAGRSPWQEVTCWRGQSSARSSFQPFLIMKTIRVSFPFRSVSAALAIAGLQFSSAVLPSAHAGNQDGQAKAKFFDWENLQSDVAGVADRSDPNLVNAWGLALNTKANIFWVADNGSGFSTLYQPDGTLVNLVVTIPPTSADKPTPPATVAQATPTGIVFNTF